MNPSRTSYIPRCTGITSNVSKKNAVKRNTKHGKMRSSKKRSAAASTSLTKLNLTRARFRDETMLRNLIIAVLFSWGSWGSARAADLKVLPADVFLTGPRAKQQLLALAVADGKVIGNLTDKAQFISSNP